MPLVQYATSAHRVGLSQPDADDGTPRDGNGAEIAFVENAGYDRAAISVLGATRAADDTAAVFNFRLWRKQSGDIPAAGAALTVTALARPTADMTATGSDVTYTSTTVFDDTPGDFSAYKPATDAPSAFIVSAFVSGDVGDGTAFGWANEDDEEGDDHLRVRTGHMTGSEVGWVGATPSDEVTYELGRPNVTGALNIEGLAGGDLMLQLESVDGADPGQYSIDVSVEMY